MSNEVFPTLPGLTPEITRTPIWSTAIKSSVSQREYRTANVSVPAYSYKLSYEVIRQGAVGGFTHAELSTLAGFFNARRGSFDSFLFSDPDDSTATAQQFGTGDGTTAAFQLARAWGGFVEPVYDVAGAAGVQMEGGLGGLGSFEVDTNADGLSDGWASYSAGTVAGLTFGRNTSTPAHGTYRQRVAATNLGTTTADRAGLSLTATGLTGGQAYTLSAHLCWLAASSAKAGLYIDWKDAAGAFISASSDLSLTLTGTLTQFALSVTAPANAVRADVYVFCHSRGVAGAATFDMDAVQLWPASAAPAVTATKIALIPGADYTLSATGLVTLAVAPAAGAALSWTGSYYRRVRFAMDSADFHKFMRSLWSLRTLELRSFKA